LPLKVPLKMAPKKAQKVGATTRMVFSSSASLFSLETL
jgi:hypothetical protein